MSEILVDEIPVHLPREMEPTVSSAFEHARDQIIEQGRIVTEVTLDGRQIEWGDGSLVWHMPFLANMSMRIGTGDPWKISISLLESLSDRLPGIADKHRKTAQLMTEADSKEVSSNILDLLRWWQEFSKAIASLHALQNAIGNEVGQNCVAKHAGPATQVLVSKLQEFHVAASKQDMDRVAELLDNDLANIADQWQDICQAIAVDLRMIAGPN